MTFDEVVERGYNEVAVISYGYNSAGIFSHYEPFAHARIIHMHIDPDMIESRSFFIDNENDCDFCINEGQYDGYGVKSGELVCFDPEITEKYGD